MKTTKEIIDEIIEIQKQPFQNSISAKSRKIHVEELHKQLDILNYKGERPPLDWAQLDPEGKFCYVHTNELMNKDGKCPKCS
jgi:hypothetical protein